MSRISSLLFASGRRDIGPIGTASRVLVGVVGRFSACSAPTCWLTAIMVATAALFSILTPVDGEVAFWVWLGASMLLAAAQGYGGCEILAAPNLLIGGRGQFGCILFTPIDRAEAKRDRTRTPVGA